MASVLFQHFFENPVPSVCSSCAGSLPRGTGGFHQVDAPSPHLLQVPLAVRLPPAPLGNCSHFPRDAGGWLMWVQKSVPFGQSGTDSTVLKTLRAPCRIRPGTDSTEATPCSAPSPLLTWSPCCLSLLSWELSFNKPLAQESPSGLEGGQCGSKS